MKKFIASLILLAVFSFISPLHADTITLVADPWMPYTGEEGSEEHGFMVEFAIKAFEKAGHEVVFKNVEWEKAVSEARAGKFSGIVGAYKEDAPDFVFPANEQGTGINHFFVSKGNPWKYNGVGSLKGKKIGIMSGYAYSDELDAYFKDNPNVVTENELIKLVQMLSEGTIDTIIEDFNVFMLLAMKSYMDEDIESAGPATESTFLYVAFSPANAKSKEYAQILSKGMDDLRQSGELKKIMEKYGLEDWK